MKLLQLIQNFFQTYIFFSISACELENIGKPVFHRYSTGLYGSWMQVIIIIIPIFFCFSNILTFYPPYWINSMYTYIIIIYQYIIQKRIISFLRAISGSRPLSITRQYVHIMCQVVTQVQFLKTLIFLFNKH